jgi:hypothetical protein
VSFTLSGDSSKYTPDRRIKFPQGWSGRFGETKLLATVENQTTIHGCPYTLENAADRYFLTVFNDILFSATEVTLRLKALIKMMTFLGAILKCF